MTRLPFKGPRFTQAARLAAFSLPATRHAYRSLLGFITGLTPLIVVVVCPAVWSRKKSRRDAALAVLNRLFRRREEK
jgi:L-lactate permease